MTTNKQKSHTEMAEWLVGVWSRSELARRLGISRHTLYVRLIEENWKESEKVTLEFYFKSLKGKL